MVVVPLAASGNEPETPSAGGQEDSRYWVRVAAAGALATSGVLLMGNKRRAALIAAAAGTALTVLDQQDTVRNWWGHLPGYLEEVQRVLNKAQGAVDELAAQGERLRNILSR